MRSQTLHSQQLQHLVGRKSLKGIVVFPLTVVWRAVAHVPADNCSIFIGPSIIAHRVEHITTTHLHPSPIHISSIIGVGGIRKLNLSIITNCICVYFILHVTMKLNHTFNAANSYVVTSTEAVVSINVARSISWAIFQRILTTSTHRFLKYRSLVG